MEFRIFVEPQQGVPYRDLARFAVAAEACGFAGFFRSDHLLPVGAFDQRGVTEAWTSLAGIALETRRIRIGTLVSPVTFRHPGLLAIQVTQVDQMSGGRAELGLGAGWFDREHAAYGVPFPAARFGLLEEQLAILRGLWSAPPDEPFSFQGAHYALRQCPSIGPLAQPGGPPLIVGGSGPRRTPVLAARYAAEYNISPATFAACDQAFARVRRECTRNGRQPASMVYPVLLTTVLGRNGSELRRRADRAGVRLDRADSPDLVGNSTRLLEQVNRYRDIGAARIYLRLLDITDLDQLGELAHALGIAGAGP